MRPALSDSARRQFLLGPSSMRGLKVYRKVFVPGDDGFVRYLELLVNPGSSDVAVTVGLETDLGSDLSSRLVSSTRAEGEFSRNRYRH